MKVRTYGFLRFVLVLLLLGSTDAGETAPYLVYGTYLGGRNKECATDIAVDSSGNAYVVGSNPVTRLSGDPTCVQQQHKSQQQRLDGICQQD